MKSRLFDRRDFLRAAGLTFAASLAPEAFAAAASADAIFATAYQKRDGQFGVAVLTDRGRLIHALTLPDRGHDITVDPVSRRSVVFARQPGTFAIVFDLAGRAEPVTIPSVAGRHFFGHGVFSPDGALLYATENDFENAAGMVGVYDATDGFRRIGEFPTHGVGPHEILLCPDGRMLAVANGGIETHPDFGSAKLNISTMKPSLAFIDRAHGELVELHELDPSLHKLSIRHMDFDHSGRLWFGCQYEGPATERPALVGSAQLGQGLDLLHLPEPVLVSLRNYVGSVAANPSAGALAVTSPQGNSLVVIDTEKRAVLEAQTLVEVCGVAPDASGFLASTGTGDVIAPTGSVHSEPDYVWDNHILAIS